MTFLCIFTENIWKNTQQTYKWSMGECERMSVLQIVLCYLKFLIETSVEFKVKICQTNQKGI